MSPVGLHLLRAAHLIRGRVQVVLAGAAQLSTPLSRGWLTDAPPDPPGVAPLKVRGPLLGLYS